MSRSRMLLRQFGFQPRTMLHYGCRQGITRPPRKGVTITRKHFTAIALMLKTQLSLSESKREAEMIARITRNLAATFSQINGSFDFARFYTAAGLTPSGYLPDITPEMVAEALSDAIKAHKR